MTTHRFKQFRVGDLFDIHPTKTYKGNNSDLFDNNGKNPVLGNTSMNNGIGGYSSKPCTENGGIITFSDTTTADAIFYQPNPFIGYSHVQGMYPYSTKWSEKSLLYFLTVFKKIAVESGFDYANKFNRKIASDFTVALPVKCSSVIDISAIMSIGGGIEMNQIDTSTWKEFHIGDIFEVKSSKKKFNACDVTILEKGYPYVVRTSANNGIRGYINEDPKYLNDGNTISFGQDTATMFYQPEPYFTGDKIKILQFKNGTLNEQSAQFFLTVMRKAFSDFSWGVSSFDENIIKGVSIYLPVTEIEEIDFNYMEARIKELEEALRVMGLHDTKLTEEEEDTLNKTPIFKTFLLSDLFDSETGDTDIQKSQINSLGEYVVTAGVDKSGIAGKTDIPAKIIKANTLTVDMFGNCFYRDFQYKMVTHARVFALIPKTPFKSREIGLYFTTQLSKYNTVYSFNNMCSWNKIKNNSIKLPILNNGEIDVDYIENYIRTKEKQVIQKLYDDKGILIDTAKVQ